MTERATVTYSIHTERLDDRWRLVASWVQPPTGWSPGDVALRRGWFAGGGEDDHRDALVDEMERMWPMAVMTGRVEQ